MDIPPMCFHQLFFPALYKNSVFETGAALQPESRDEKIHAARSGVTAGNGNQRYATRVKTPACCQPEVWVIPPA